MTHEIRLPAVSEGVTEGIVVGIVVAVGDQINVDQTLLELETDPTHCHVRGASRQFFELGWA